MRRALLGPRGRVGAIAKSSFKGLGHREPIFPDETAVASSLAKAYVDMGFSRSTSESTTLEEAAPDIDWRFHPGELNVLSERLQASYSTGSRSVISPPMIPSPPLEFPALLAGLADHGERAALTFYRGQGPGGTPRLRGAGRSGSRQWPATCRSGSGVRPAIGWRCCPPTGWRCRCWCWPSFGLVRRSFPSTQPRLPRTGGTSSGHSGARGLCATRGASRTGGGQVPAGVRPAHRGISSLTGRAPEPPAGLSDQTGRGPLHLGDDRQSQGRGPPPAQSPRQRVEHGDQLPRSPGPPSSRCSRSITRTPSASG